MAKLDTKIEKAYRQQIAVAQGIIDECNRELIAGGCEPEPDSVVKTGKAIANGVVAKTGSFFQNLGKNIKDSYESTKQAGEVRIAEKEIDRQVADQMKALKEKLHAAVTA